MLVDTVREQNGESAFEIVEMIRQISLRYHRDDDEPAKRELKEILNRLDPVQTLDVIRAFSCFSRDAKTQQRIHSKHESITSVCPLTA